MKINPTYKSLLSKSINSMLSAIEIYNKPNFLYREETFAILAVNAIELLFKAHLLKLHNYSIKELYVMEPIKTKKGKVHKRRKTPKLNRSKNPMTIGIFDVINKLKNKCKLSDNFISNIEVLVELRDNSIHFYNESFCQKEIQEIGFATIKNYIRIIEEWNIVDIDLSKYNLYLMPLAYIDSKTYSLGIITDETENYIEFLKSKIENIDNEDQEYDIAVSIDIKFNKSNSIGQIGVKYDPDGIPVNLKEEDINAKYPLTHTEICKKSRIRYIDFKQGREFNNIMANIKKNKNLSYVRSLDPNKPNVNSKYFYSSNIWKELDKHYTKEKNKPNN